MRPISLGVLSRVRALATLFAISGAGACGSLLDTSPVDQLPDDKAITNAAGARAALAGAYDGLQDLSYYGGEYLFFNDLIADNAIHNGTFSEYADADQHLIQAANVSVADIWNALYNAISRVNLIIQKVPALNDLAAVEKDQILGEAYFLRALHYHNLVRLWGGVPLRLVPPASVDDASNITRSTAAEVYTQIATDLGEAEARITNAAPTSRGSVGAVKALQARVFLYQQNWASANAKADEVIALGYTLAPAIADLFDAEGQDTPEDIFKLTFTDSDYQNIGYYYLSYNSGGRSEVAVDPNLIAVSDPADDRLAFGVNQNESPAEGTKFPTPIGAEDVHVIRFAEVILIKAEAMARLNNLDSAVAEYNKIRVRALLPAHVLGVDVTTQQTVLDAIDLERRLELAFEGDRFADLVRTGRAQAVLGIPAYQEVLPVPLREIDVAPGITQNPGY
jgi:hypothetical protein